MLVKAFFVTKSPFGYSQNLPMKSTSTSFRVSALAGMLAFLSSTLLAAPEASPTPEQLYNVSLTELGATAKGSGVPFNKDWPANNTL